MYSNKLQHAISFAIKVHQLDQNQTRKGKNDPYITHPLSIAIILAKVGANDDTIIAGILHDTIEDSTENNKVTKEQITKLFGTYVARMVNDVTEQDKSLPWAVRKQRALEHIPQMGKDSQLVKSADVLHNLTSLINDYEEQGDQMFNKFKAPKSAQLQRYKKLITVFKINWSDNPLMNDLETVLKKAEELWS
jgi:(p)ppGpp synthase/HD superfamily hydrolase